MPYLQLGDSQFPLRVGEMGVGSAPGAAIRFPGDGTLEALLQTSPDGGVSIRRARPDSVIRVNGVQLGMEPTPLIHGDKLDIGGHEFFFGDERRLGGTHFIAERAHDLASSGGRPTSPTAASGGRLVSLVDGREYPVPPEGLVLGRDPGCDVVVPSAEVSRRHARIGVSPDGYDVHDTSTNGVFVNGVRVEQSRRLGRGDVLRIADEEFRFYADVPAPERPDATPAEPPGIAPPAAATLARSAPPITSSPARAESAPGSGPRPALATLEILNEGVRKGSRFEIRTPLAHIGRGAHNDVILQDESVSETHAKLQRRDAGWVVVDMNSTNGTYVAGRRIHGEHPLELSSSVRFGGVKLAFRAVGDVPLSAGGTRAITGVSVDQLRQIDEAPHAVRPMAGRPAEPRDEGAGSRVPVFVWVLALALGALALIFVWQGRS